MDFALLSRAPPLLTGLAIGPAFVVILPRFLARIRLPGILGFIPAGVLLGPGISGVLREDVENLKSWSELGKPLFMFFVGFEIDLEQFGRVRLRVGLFGPPTFVFPLALGMGSATGYTRVSCVPIGSIVASHTLLAAR